MPCRLYLVNCLANYSSYLIPRFYPLQFASIHTVFSHNEISILCDKPVSLAKKVRHFDCSSCSSCMSASDSAQN